MSNESLFLRSPRPQHDLVENPELHPSTSGHNNVHQQNGHQSDANFASAYHHPTRNYAGYGHRAQYRGSPYHNNPWFDGPPPAAGQYTYQMNPNNIGYPSSGNTQNIVLPGPSRGEYYVPPAHDISGGGVRYRPPPMPDVADAFSRSVPESAPSGMSAVDGLKPLADRYLHDPGSQVNTLRMGLSPSSGRLRVMIVLDIDI
ncbi:hypothetical protein EDB89DRAFT_1977193 [Lactarius sanguifluus]|nr:hypothetical protein EDB89DRAFT_1977193 [Lactarius sanguifluus]